MDTDRHGSERRNPAALSLTTDRLKAGLQTPKTASNPVRSPGFSRSLARPTAKMRTAGRNRIDLGGESAQVPISYLCPSEFICG